MNLQQPPAHWPASAINPATGRLGQALGGLAVASAWTIYLPLGAKYAAYLLTAMLSLAWLTRSGQLRATLRSPWLRAPLALWLLLVLSAAWSTAPIEDRWSHVWHYGRVLLMPFIALACPAAAARRGLRHFVLASAVVAAFTVLDRFQPLPASLLWDSTVQAMGNQRIVTSLLLALGVAFALIEAADTQQTKPRRVLWLLAAVFTALALTLQDRRTGMVALPVMLAALAVSRQRTRPHAGWRSAALLGGVALLAALTWQQSATVRARFDEGLSELRAYQPSGVVATSWGMRMRMIDVTLDMVREKPLLGHGLGSWLTQWRQRTQGGGQLLEAQMTPHNEYLLITEQAGLVGLALWLTVLATFIATAWRAGRAGDAALMVFVALAWSALFSVAIRDAKFAMSLLMLAGLAVASTQGRRQAVASA